LKMKKGQIEINETLMVLFVIVVIIIIGMFVYFRFSLANVEKLGSELSEEESTILLASASALQEIRCSEDECVDTSKFIPFMDHLKKDNEYYNKLLGYKKIVFEQVYPDVQSQGECNLELYSQEDYPENCRYWVLYDNKPQKTGQKITISTFVSLYFPEINEHRIGRLEVTTYA